MSRTLSPCPDFTAEAGLWARVVAMLTSALPIKGKVPRLEAVRADTPMPQVPYPAAQSKHLGLFPKRLSCPPISTPMNQNLPGWGQGHQQFRSFTEESMPRPGKRTSAVNSEVLKCVLHLGLKEADSQNGGSPLRNSSSLKGQITSSNTFSSQVNNAKEGVWRGLGETRRHTSSPGDYGPVEVYTQ